jgi:hypothetical protein
MGQIGFNRNEIEFVPCFALLDLNHLMVMVGEVCIIKVQNHNKDQIDPEDKNVHPP